MNKLFDTINGWFNLEDRIIFDIILSSIRSYIGNLLEIGVYEGKVISKYAQYSKDEKIICIDPYMDENIIISNVKKINQEYDITKIEFNHILSIFYNKIIQNSIKMFHIDGSHSGKDVYNDLYIADQMLTYNGILVIDDFNDSIYNGISEAYYKYNYIAKEPFNIFLISEKKAYCCRRKYISSINELIDKIIKEYKNNIFGNEYKLIRLLKTVSNYNYLVLTKKSESYIDSGVSETYEII